MPMPTVYVEAPPAVVLPFGLMSVVQFTTPTDPHEYGGVTWESQNCAATTVTRDPCIIDEAVAALTPIAGFCQVGTSEPFHVVALYDDTLLFADVDEATERFAAAEQAGAEAWLAAKLAVEVPAPVDVSTFTADNIDGVWAAIALVEQMMAESFPHQGVVHVDRFAAALVADRLVAQGGVKRTPLGTPVVAGGGYLDANLAVPTAATVYGTGPILARRGTLQRHRSIDTATNDVSTLIERPYSLGWDCAAVAAVYTY